MKDHYNFRHIYNEEAYWIADAIHSHLLANEGRTPCGKRL